MRAIVDTALSRQRAHLVLVTGGAGVGKSRLASEVARHAEEEHGARVFTGRCVPYGEDIWWPIAETIRTVCEIAPNASHEEARGRVYEAVAKAAARDLEDPEVARIGRGLLFLLGYAQELSDLDPVRARDDALRSGQALFGRLAQVTPVILVLSDLHWADDLVLDLVNGLLGALRTLPFVLVATARPDLDERWRPEPGRNNLSVLNLEPLDGTAVTRLVEELLGDDATPELVDVLRERSGGNPFFVEELAALIRESGTGALDARRAQRLPATLQGLVTARLDTLEPTDRAVIEDCAVVGASGPLDAVLALVAARGTDDAPASLSRLVDRELLDVDRDEVRFPSEVVRDVAYGMLTKAERARRHATLADWLAGTIGEDDGATSALERVAHHYGAAALLLRELGTVDGVPADLGARALRTLEHAANRARVAELWPSAGRLFEQALAVLPSDAADETRWRLLLGYATALAAQQDVAAAGTVVEEILGNDPDERTTARALTVLTDVRQMTGDVAGAIATAEEALDRWRALGDDRGAADALRSRGRIYMFLGELDAADRDFSEALHAFRDAGDRRGEAWALQNLASIAFFRSDSERAEDRLDRSVAAFREVGDYGGVNWCEGIRAWVRFIQGRLDEAEALAYEQLPETETTGNRWVAGILCLLLANLALWRGDSQRAVAHAEDTVARFGAIGDQWGQTQARSTLVRALICVGRVDDGLDTLDDEVAAELGIVWPRLLRAQVLVHLGAPDALAAALHLGGMDQYRHNDELVASVRLVLGLALLQAGRVAEALAEFEAADTDSAGLATGSRLAVTAGLALGCAAEGRAEEARRLADAARGAGTYLDQIQHGLAGAFARLQLGDADAEAAFDEVVTLADATEARLDQAIVRLARAHAAASREWPDADEAMLDARARLESIGVGATGWSQLFSAAAGS